MGRRDADLLVGRQQADQDGRHAHDHERQHQHALAADLVAEMAEDDAAQRTGDEADGEGGVGQQRRDEGSPTGKYSLLKTMPATTP